MNLQKKFLCIFLIGLIILGFISAIDVTRVFGQPLIITLKWRVNAGTGSTWLGPLAADLNNDGLMEIVITGKNGIAALDPINGSVIWSQPYGGDHVPIEIIDLNKDGIPEILLGPQYINGSSGGVLALHGNNGSVYWYNRQAACKGTYIAVADINADGYPEIYSATPGRITALTYDGRIFASTYTYYTCWGGMTIGDTDFDGVFEVYLGERHTGFDPSARGLRAFWADNLTERWAHPDILCSSQAPVLADVDKDGNLEIIVLHQRKGIAVIKNDGSVYRKQLTISSLPSNGHTNPTVADVDGDGNLELLHCGQADLGWYTPAIFDLVNWKVEAELPFQSIDPPGVADITGDGKLEIIAPNQKNVTIFKYNASTKNYDIIGTIPLAMAHPFFIAQDIDNNGKLNLVFNTYNSWVYVYEVEAPAPTPKPRSGLTFYSQYRTRVPVYVPPPGPPAPKITEVSPNDGATNVPVWLSELSFKLTDYQCDPINYTVITDPDIGSASDINAPNGKITVPVSGLAYSTTYTWTVTATDGTHTTTKTFTFTTASLAQWYNVGWRYRKMIAIDHTKVVADQTNFPVLIDLTDAVLKAKAQEDGDDILFTDQDGVKLSHEIEYYDSATGHLIAWVRVPYLSSTEDTKLYMYYDNPNCEDQQNPAEVWDANYKLVLHLNEKTGTHYDSTINGNNGTPFGNLVQGVTGFIVNCVEFNGGYIELPRVCTSEVQFTFSAWIYARTGARYIISEWWNSQGALLQVSSDGRYIEFYVNNIVVSRPITLNTWYYVVGTFDGTTSRLYVNAGSPASASASNPAWPSQNMYIGDRSDHNRKFNGFIDEVKVSSVVRSAAWILTEYNNQLNPAAFYTLSPEETLPDQPCISEPNPPDGAKNVSRYLSELSFKIIDYQNDLMNVTVTTIPNIGSLERLNVPSGTYSVSISSLAYSKTYTWTVTVTDGKYTTTKTYTFTTESGDDIIFNSKFDMGNLINVTFVEAREGYRHYKAAVNYTIGYDPVASRTNNDKHWWFYFSMENIAGKTIAISIVNGTDADWSTSTTAGNRWPEIEPVYSYDNKNWERVPLSCVTWNRSTKTYTINMTFPTTQNKVWLAPLPPYTIARRDALFAEFASSPYLNVTSLGTTPGGQQLLVATITDPAYPNEGKIKSYVIAQQHAAEVPSSWTAEGLIRFLLSEDPTAAAIRRSYIFRIVPIVNVDAVYQGICRYTPIRNDYQYDLNRQWSLAASGSTSPNLQPEIKWIWQDLLAFKPHSFNDLHTTINVEMGTSRDVVTYTWSTTDAIVVAFRNKLKQAGYPETQVGTTSYACKVVHDSIGVYESVSWELPHDEYINNPGVKLTINDWMSWGAAWAKGNYLHFGDWVHFVGVGSGSGTTGNPTPGYPPRLQAGDLILLQVTVGDTTNTPATPTGFTLLYGPDSTGTGRQWIYYKFATGSESGTITITIGGTSCKMALMYAFRNVASANFNESAAFTSGTGSTISAPSVTTSGDGRLAVAFVFINDDNAVDSFTGETGGDWQEAMPEYTTTAGNDGCIQLQTAPMYNAGTISGGAYTMSATDPWGVRAFALKPAVYTLEVNVTEGGSISINPAKAFYIYGEEVTLEAIPKTGYKFNNWSGDLTVTDNPATITVTKNMVITAHFAPVKQYVIIASVSGTGGTINPSGEVLIESGQNQTFVMNPDYGYHVSNVIVDGVPIEPVTSYTFNFVDSNHTIIVEFELNKYTLTINIDGEGVVNINPNKTLYSHGETVQLLAIPNDGWRFSHWSGDLTGSANPATITVDGHKTITAHFTRVIFQSGYDTGDFSEWTGTSATSGGSITVVTTDPHHGTYHSQASMSAVSGSVRYAYAYETLDLSEFYVRFYFKLKDNLPFATSSDELMLIYARAGTTGIFQAGFGAATGYLRGNYRSGTSWTSWGNTSIRAELDVWHCIEIYWKKDASNGVFRVYYDGVVVFERTGINTSQYGNVTEIRVGCTRYYFASAQALRVFTDCVVVANTHIEPEGSSA